MDGMQGGSTLQSSAIIDLKLAETYIPFALCIMKALLLTVIQYMFSLALQLYRQQSTLICIILFMMDRMYFPIGGIKHEKIVDSNALCWHMLVCCMVVDFFQTWTVSPSMLLPIPSPVPLFVSSHTKSAQDSVMNASARLLVPDENHPQNTVYNMHANADEKLVHGILSNKSDALEHSSAFGDSMQVFFVLWMMGSLFLIMWDSVPGIHKNLLVGACRHFFHHTAPNASCQQDSIPSVCMNVHETPLQSLDMHTRDISHHPTCILEWVLLTVNMLCIIGMACIHGFQDEYAVFASKRSYGMLFCNILFVFMSCLWSYIMCACVVDRNHMHLLQLRSGNLHSTLYSKPKKTMNVNKYAGKWLAQHTSVLIINRFVCLLYCPPRLCIAWSMIVLLWMSCIWVEKSNAARSPKRDRTALTHTDVSPTVTVEGNIHNAGKSAICTSSPSFQSSQPQEMLAYAKHHVSYAKHASVDACQSTQETLNHTSMTHYHPTQNCEDPSEDMKLLLEAKKRNGFIH
jgi:hypothetical protein